MALSREEEVDLTLLKNDSGVESALLYAKAWSKYVKDLLAWMDKRLAMGETLTPYIGHCFTDSVAPYPKETSDVCPGGPKLVKMADLQGHNESLHGALRAALQAALQAALRACRPAIFNTF